jgi:hypothetical protein
LPGTPPAPTYVYRLMHIDNLSLCLSRRGLHAPHHCPADGGTYRVIHDTEVQAKRGAYFISCGPRGVIHDYVSFYFGYLSPMLLRLHTGRVAGHSGDQSSLLYLVTTVQVIRDSAIPFVFSDGHGIARFTEWFDSLDRLDAVDWDTVFQRYWADTTEDMDRQRRKQAEFLIHHFCPWDLIRGIAVIDEAARARVAAIIQGFPAEMARPTKIVRQWYY